MKYENWLANLFRRNVIRQRTGRPRKYRFQCANATEALEVRSLLTGLVIQPTFDSTIQNDPNAGQIEGDIQSACALYNQLYTNPITVKIDFIEDNTISLANSNTPRKSENWTDVYHALISHETSTADVKAMNSSLIPVGANNPVDGSPNMLLTNPNARALGLPNDTGSANGFDAVIRLNISKMFLDASNPDSSKFFLMTAAEHEMDEVLGTSSGLRVGATSPGTPQTTDLFRYDNSGNRSYTLNNNATAVFAPFGGTHQVIEWNQTGTKANPSDYGDWKNDAILGPHVQDAFGTRGATEQLGFEEKLLLDVIGWDLKQQDLAPTDISISNSSIAEDEAAGTAVGTFSSKDVGTSQIYSYSLVPGTGATDNSRFTIDASGFLHTASVFDFETKSSFSIRVRSTDPGGGSVEKAFTINVNNIQENPFLVDTLSDIDNGDYSAGNMSLREAIRLANNKPGADVIQFAPNLTGTILMNGTRLPAITDDLQIIGSGAQKLTINGNDRSQILLIDSSAGNIDPPRPGTLNVSISGLTFSHGRTPDNFQPISSGGAIQNLQGNLSLKNVTIRDSHSGRDGGAVENFLGTLIADNCAFINNTAVQFGGAIMSEDFGGNEALLSMTNTTVSGNRANRFGGGILVLTGAAEMVNCTIVGNHSDNDNNSQISNPENGGGIAMSGRAPDVELDCTIVAGNFIGSGATTPSDVNGASSNLPPFFTVSTVDPNSSFNLIGDAGSAGGLRNGTNNNIVGNAGTGTLAVGRIVRSTLETNPLGTFDLPLVAGSLAIDAGSAFLIDGSPLPTDQRGFPRAVDADGNGSATVDIGAVEMQPAVVANVPRAVGYFENAAPSVLIPQVAVTDVDNSGFVGGSLKIVSGSADIFDRIGLQSSATGAFQISGGNIVSSGATIASFTGGNASNPFVINFKTGITAALVQSIMQNLTFSSIGDDVVSGSTNLTFTLKNAAGAVNNKTGIVVFVTGVNDAPILNTTLNLTLAAINQGDTIPKSTKVSDMLKTAVTDPDGPGSGIAVTNAPETNGHWEFSLNGTTFTAMNSPTEAAALLLPASALVRFTPNPQFFGTVTLSFRAWDQSAGTAGRTLATATNQGGSNSLSIPVANATLTVNHVNSPAAFQNRSITPSITEGGMVFVKGHITDRDTQDPFFLDVDWGDGTALQHYYFAPGTPRDIKVGHRYLDNPTDTDDKYTVHLSWHDQVSKPKSATLTTIVHNAAPRLGEVTASTNQVVGKPIVLQGTISDPGVNDTFKVLVQWDSNGPWQTLTLPAGSKFFQVQHKYATIGKKQVTILLFDKDLDFTASSLVLNVHR